jgi:hypothetical protein
MSDMEIYQQLLGIGNLKLGGTVGRSLRASDSAFARKAFSIQRVDDRTRASFFSRHRGGANNHCFGSALRSPKPLSRSGPLSANS